MKRICSTLCVALCATAALAQDEAPASARGWEVGAIYRVHVERHHTDSTDTQYPESMRWPGHQTKVEFGYRFRYLDRVDAVGGSQATEVTRHIVKAVRFEGDVETPLAIEGRRFQLWFDQRGAYRVRGFDGAELEPAIVAQVELACFPSDPRDFGPPRKQSQGLAKAAINRDWPDAAFRLLPMVVTRCVAFGWAPMIRQGKWQARFEGDLQPLGKARFEVRIMGDVDDEEDGIPVVVEKGREVTVELEVLGDDVEALPDSAEVALQAVRDQAAAGEVAAARQAWEALADGAARWPQPLQAEYRALETELTE